MSTALPTPPPPSSAESIGGSEDLLTEILSYLPTKGLLRLKSVNKQWCSLISDPNFCLLHSLRHPHPPSSALFFLLHHHNNHPHSLSSSSFDYVSLSPSPHSPPPFSLSSSPDILQSCNGLLLCSSPQTILICNPTSGRSTPIPRPMVGEPSKFHLAMAFDPSRWAHYYLLCVSPNSNLDSFTLDVYSSNTQSWVNVVDRFDNPPFDVEFDRGVYWNGKVLWLSHTDSTLYYDVERECVESLALPKAAEGTYIERFRYFGESRGLLHLIEIRTNCVQEFDVLELSEKEGEMEWFVKYRVDLNVLGCGFESELFQDHIDRFGRRLRFYAFSILAVVCGMGGDVVDDDDALVLSIPGKVISYSLKTKVSRLVCNVVDESDKLFPFRGYNAFQFFESLYCV